ncbi:MAG: FMN-binding protein [Eubacteriales bacterium]|nr:FMN-binding protein [Eubacteriales bacterium]
MKKHAWLVLLTITIVAGFALSLTNLVTEAPIERQKLLSRNAARVAVFSGADSFTELAVVQGSKIDSVYTALQNGVTVGYVMQTTVSGYGGPIEIVMGVDENGAITGLSVGGNSFAETAGLGARTRDPAFTDQFIGLTAAPELKINIDAISGATISSSAVTNGANLCYRYCQMLHGIIVQGGDATSSATPGTSIDATTSATIGSVNAAVTATPGTSVDATTSATTGGSVNAAAAATPGTGVDANTSATIGSSVTAAATATPGTSVDATTSATIGSSVNAAAAATPGTGVDATASATVAYRDEEDD